MADYKSQNIPGMNLGGNNNNGSVGKPATSPENNEKMQKEMEKTKKELDKLKSWIVKKYKFTKSISILPPQAVPIFVDEEEVPKQTEKHIHLYMVVPEEKYKEIPTFQKEIVKEIEKIKGQKVWLQIKTPVDLWEMALDSKFDMVGAVSMSFPLFDTGFLGVMRMMEIHKSLVLRKFDKYVVSYVLVGSLIRGEATPTSDADIAIIINDTDVKRMPRLELKERLRKMIYDFVPEAASLAGVKNTLHIQTYLLTDFWESVKDASPVIFTFIRDGVPIYDRGTFMPWKALLKMGKLRPSAESIDMFMKTADKTKDMIKRRLADATIDLYYGVLNPSQALLMLHGLPPPTHGETPKLMDDIFVKKEKMLKKADIAILEKAYKLFKKLEHEPDYALSGKELDNLIKQSNDYLNKLKELRKKIEKTSQERTIEQIYNDVFDLLKKITKKKSQLDVVKSFEKDFIKKGKFTGQHLKILNNIVNAKNEFKKGKLSPHKIDEARKNYTLLIGDLLDYTQRADLMDLAKKRLILKIKEGIAEVLKFGKDVFLVNGNIVKKIGDKIEDSSKEELAKAFEVNKNDESSVEINSRVFALLKKELGDFEVVL